MDTHLQPGPGGRQEQWPEEGGGATTGNGGINSDRDVSQEAASPTDSPAATKRRDGKNTTPGQRFACTRCSKTYTRIENLTRHQANRKLISMSRRVNIYIRRCPRRCIELKVTFPSCPAGEVPPVLSLSSIHS